MASGRESSLRTRCNISPDNPTRLAPRAKHLAMSSGIFTPPEAMIGVRLPWASMRDVKVVCPQSSRKSSLSSLRRPFSILAKFVPPVPLMSMAATPILSSCAMASRLNPNPTSFTITGTALALTISSMFLSQLLKTRSPSGITSSCARLT